MVLKERIFNSFYLRDWCGDLERTDFEQFLPEERCGDLERTDF